MILGQDVVGDKLSGVWRRKGINGDGGKSFVLYKVRKPPDVVLYSVCLYQGSDPLPAHDLASAALTKGSTEMVCMTNLVKVADGPL